MRMNRIQYISRDSRVFKLKFMGDENTHLDYQVEIIDLKREIKIRKGRENSQGKVSIS